MGAGQEKETEESLSVWEHRLVGALTCCLSRAASSSVETWSSGQVPCIYWSSRQVPCIWSIKQVPSSASSASHRTSAMLLASV